MIDKKWWYFCEAVSSIISKILTGFLYLIVYKSKLNIHHFYTSSFCELCPQVTTVHGSFFVFEKMQPSKFVRLNGVCYETHSNHWFMDLACLAIMSNLKKKWYEKYLYASYTLGFQKNWPHGARGKSLRGHVASAHGSRGKRPRYAHGTLGLPWHTVGIRGSAHGTMYECHPSFSLPNCISLYKIDPKVW